MTTTRNLIHFDTNVIQTTCRPQSIDMYQITEAIFIFWNLRPCIFLNVYRRFGRTWCISFLWVISSFRRGAYEIFVLLDVTQLCLTVTDLSVQPIGSHFQGTSSSGALDWNAGKKLPINAAWHLRSAIAHTLSTLDREKTGFSKIRIFISQTTRRHEPHNRTFIASLLRASNLINCKPPVYFNINRLH